MIHHPNNFSPLKIQGLPPQNKAPRNAFTLIELLVVIAIIAILAAMLLPVLNRAKQAGLKAQEINNFKQLELCWHMYILDNNDYLPPNYATGGTASNSWVNGDAQTDYTTINLQNGLLYQYNQQVKLYACPANTKMVTAPASLPLHPTSYKVPQVRTCSIEYSLGGNSSSGPLGPWMISRGGITWNSYQKFSKIQATRIVKKIVFADESEATLDDSAFADYPDGSGLNSWFNVPCNRHDNGTVWSFADGHCEYWKWHGLLVNTYVYQNVYYTDTADGGVGTGNSYPGDGGVSGPPTSDDLPRTEAGGAQYP